MLGPFPLGGRLQSAIQISRFGVIPKGHNESLVGHLNHACKVVRPGRSFLRRMIALLQQYRNKYHPIRLNHGFRSDLHWWACFAAQWNGTSYIATGVQVRFATDASGNWGCGAWHQRSWFQWKWDDVTRLLAIAVKELLPIILATLVWGRLWYGTAFWAIAVVAFFGFFRLGELLLESGTTYNSVLHLSWGDISIDSLTNPSMVKVHAPQKVQV